MKVFINDIFLNSDVILNKRKAINDEVYIRIEVAKRKDKPDITKFFGNYDDENSQEKVGVIDADSLDAGSLQPAQGAGRGGIIDRFFLRGF